MPTGPHVLMVDDQPHLLSPLVRQLERDGHRVSVAASGEEALAQAAAELPDVIVADVDMPGMDGFELVQRLRSMRRTAMVPILFLSGHGELPRRVRGLEGGGDDFVQKPVEYDELRARLSALLARARRSSGANPLTGLPGNTAIELEVSRRVKEGSPFALAYIDIDFFKSFNDARGFAKGDEVLKALAHILLDSLSREGKPEDFVGHIGGDDFILVTEPLRVGTILNRVAHEFDNVAPGFYGEAARSEGGLRAKDRQGNDRMYPFVRLSIGVTSTEKRKFESYAEAAGIASEMKAFAKKKERKGSTIAIDSRTR